MKTTQYTFSKEERLCSKRTIETLFDGGARSFSMFPLRVVYLPVADTGKLPGASVLITVSKKRFKRAVKRNRIKRQIREAYRLNKSSLNRVLKEKGIYLPIAFIYLGNEVPCWQEIEEKVRISLLRIEEKFL
ncbi:MAG: ribonuclease P protein component [Bacteroides sp.]|nr:ribonuclease P protein component [Bacteroides sp.]